MKKILIVDDSPFIRMVLKDIILQTFSSQNNHEILEADSGNEALSQIKHEMPDLVLLDIIMTEGETEGVNVLKTISETSPQTRVIMITAVGHNAMIERCRELGVKDYIVKPFEEDQITDALIKYL